MVAVVNTKPTVLTGLVVGNVDANGNSPVLSTGANPLMNDGKASACLEVQSSVGALLVPRMTTLDKTTLNDCDGMIVFDTDLKAFCGRNATRGGFEPWVTGLGNVELLTKVIPHADVLTLNNIPVTLLPAPGAGKFYNVLNVSVSINFAGAAFANAGALHVRYFGGGNIDVCGQTFEDVAVSAASSIKSATVSQFLEAAVNMVNLPIQLFKAVPNYINGGTSTLTVNIWYTVSTL